MSKRITDNKHSLAVRQCADPAPYLVVIPALRLSPLVGHGFVRRLVEVGLRNHDQRLDGDEHLGRRERWEQCGCTLTQDGFGVHLALSRSLARTSRLLSKWAPGCHIGLNSVLAACDVPRTLYQGLAARQLTRRRPGKIATSPRSTAARPTCTAVDTSGFQLSPLSPLHVPSSDRHTLPQL